MALFGKTKDDEDRFPKRLCSYEVVKELGEGCFAKVVLAQVKPAGEKEQCEVALKLVDLSKIEDSTAMACAEKEFEAARRLLNHPKIVQTFATFKDLSKNRLVLVQEFMPCGDLERFIHYEFLTCNRLLPEHKIWFIFEQVAAAIRFMHERRILHRDLKPANVMMGQDLLVKVGDFGLSRMRSSMTAEVKTVCGTPYYMSPERILQKGYTYASDVWSLGCILFELSTAVSPFFGERHNSYSLSKKVENADFPPVPEDCYSPFLLRLIRLCLEAEFYERPSANVVHRYATRMNRFFTTKRNQLKYVCRFMVLSMQRSLLSTPKFGSIRPVLLVVSMLIVVFYWLIAIPVCFYIYRKFIKEKSRGDDVKADANKAPVPKKKGKASKKHRRD